MKHKYVKAETGGPKKHDCPDCRYCQVCSDSRCAVCRGDGCKRPPLSMERQIDFYQEINADDEHPPWKPLKIRK